MTGPSGWIGVAAGKGGEMELMAPGRQPPQVPAPADERAPRIDPPAGGQPVQLGREDVLQRVTKHEDRDAQGVLDGKLDGFIDAYLEAQSMQQA